MRCTLLEDGFLLVFCGYFAAPHQLSYMIITAASCETPRPKRQMPGQMDYPIFDSILSQNCFSRKIVFFWDFCRKMAISSTITLCACYTCPLESRGTYPGFILVIRGLFRVYIC